MAVGPLQESDTVAAARHALAAASRPRAVGPGPETEQVRRAYLDLLKLALCDLTGTSTISVGRLEDGSVAWRELSGDQLGVRSIGMDWPLQGLTMVGRARLDDLQRCLQSVVVERIEGDVIEAGVWRGGAAILARATLDSMGARERTVWVADSFCGFPEAERSEDRWEAIDYLAVSRDEVQANFERFGLDHGVEFVEGFFADTLPALRDRRWALIRLDGDTYEATWTALEALYPQLTPGGYLVIDDYGALRECRTAVEEFRAAHGIEEPLERVDWTGVRWRRESAAFEPQPRERTAPDVMRAGSGPSSRPASRGQTHIPSFHELALEQELAALRARLQHAEAELARRRANPLAALRARAGRELGRRRES